MIFGKKDAKVEAKAAAPKTRARRTTKLKGATKMEAKAAEAVVKADAKAEDQAVRETAKTEAADARAASQTEAKDARANTKTGAASPEAQATPKEQRQAAQKLFDKADEQGKADIISDTQARIGALGY